MSSNRSSAVSALLCMVFAAACGPTPAQDPGPGGSPNPAGPAHCDGNWPGDGIGPAQEGDFRCNGGEIEICTGGSWQTHASCTCTVSVGDPAKPPYPTHCDNLYASIEADGGVTVPPEVACEYAFSQCLVCRGVTALPSGETAGCSAP
jgi:hypothetical protein